MKTMLQTGIFFHYQQGNRLQDFPQALGTLLSRENVFLYDANYPSKPASEYDLTTIPIELIYRVHTPAMVEQVREFGQFDGALFSVSGTVAAATRIWKGEIDNAFVFTGYGDHHAGTDFFGGGCYFNGAAVAIRELQQRFEARKFAIIDTDAHHGDGTWDIFKDDQDVQYICLCSGRDAETNHKINVRVPSQLDDQAYLHLLSGRLGKVAAFRPELIFWNWGYDGTRGEYADMGLTPGLHARLAAVLQNAAGRICSGRLITVLCGGSRRDLARKLIPGIIEVLARE